jgi:hypothetical protein
MSNEYEIIGGYDFGEVGFEIRRFKSEVRIFIRSKIHHAPSEDVSWSDEHSSAIRIKHLDEAASALDSAARLLRQSEWESV